MARDAALLIVKYGLAGLPEAKSLPVFETCISRAEIYSEPKITVITITINSNGLRIVILLTGKILIRDMAIAFVSLFKAHNMCTGLSSASPTLLTTAQTCCQQGS
jgi:hypothetical protein